MYNAGRPINAHYILNIRPGSFAPRNQWKNALETNFINASHWYVHTLYKPPFLIVKPRTYLCYLCFCILFHFILFFIWLIHIIPDWSEYVVCYTVVLIDSLQVIHMTMSFQVILHQFGYNKFYDHHILVLKNTCLDDSTDLLGYLVVYYLKIIVLCSLNNKYFVSSVFYFFFAYHYSNRGHSVFVKC